MYIYTGDVTFFWICRLTRVLWRITAEQYAIIRRHGSFYRFFLCLSRFVSYIDRNFVVICWIRCTCTYSVTSIKQKHSRLFELYNYFRLCNICIRISQPQQDCQKSIGLILTLFNSILLNQIPLHCCLDI